MSQAYRASGTATNLARRFRAARDDLGTICAVTFILAAVVRLIVVIQISDSPFFSILVGDGRNYHSWATDIAYGRGSSEVFFQGPAYPYFLALLLQLPGDGFWVSRLAQAVLAGAGSALLAS